MVAMPDHSVLAVLLSDAGVERDTESQETTLSDAAAESGVSEELDPMSVDLGADEPEELWEDWKDTYAREVGISRWREL